MEIVGINITIIKSCQLNDTENPSKNNSKITSLDKYNKLYDDFNISIMPTLVINNLKYRVYLNIMINVF